MSDSVTFAEVFSELGAKRSLSPERVHQVFAAIFEGRWTAAQIAGFLVALRLVGESAEIIAAAASAMRQAMLRVEHSFPLVLDTCGTGGDHSRTLNLSTGAAVIAAASGVPVAKHGNRAATSKSGSADVLEALGIPVDVAAASQKDVLTRANITFLFAQAHHPSMRHAMPVRRELGIRTLFNCLGPLANPAGATHQLLGAFDHDIRPVLAGALKALGARRAWVVRSVDGMDEISPYAPTRVTALDGGSIEEFEIAPEDFGITPSAPGAVDGGEPKDNARVLEAVLRGEPHPSSDAFVLNAAAALVVAEGLAPRAATDKARELIASGAALRTLNTWREAVAAVRATQGG
ncbi:MAG TPA: anthranilate phosphoribosyltransferase [Polyangiaceae bacterium]|nr:anthranilate phosphoribosyltransferase [Polyangiaceae bacterium]